MQRLVKKIFIISFFVFLLFDFQSKTRVLNHDPHINANSYSNDPTIESESFVFSQVFGNETTDNDDIAPIFDLPPPESAWLLTDPYFTPGDGDDSNENVILPRTIYKTYFQKRSGFQTVEDMHPNLILAHKSWTEMNPGYVVRYFDLDKARRYLSRHFHPVFLRAFDCVPPFAAKSDIFRIAILYREGGWYSDWKEVCLKNHTLQNISERTNFFYFKSGGCVSNSLIGSKQRHPILAKMLELVLMNVHKSYYSSGPEGAFDDWRMGPLLTTGPCVLKKAIDTIEEERNSTIISQNAGQTIKGHPTYGGCFEWNGDIVAKHKCEGCGQGGGSNWGDEGNDYGLLYKQRNFYCQDAASIFLTTDN